MDKKITSVWPVLKWTILLPVTLSVYFIYGLYRLNLLHWLILVGLIYILFDFTCYMFAAGAFIPADWWRLIGDLPLWTQFALVYGIFGFFAVAEGLFITLNAKRVVKYK